MELEIYLKCINNAIIIYGNYRHSLKLQGLIGYYICILWSSKDWMGIAYVSFGIQGIKNYGWINGFPNKQPLCSTLALIHIKKFIEPQITIKNGILVFSFNSWDVFFFNYRRHFMVLRLGLSFDISHVLTFCSLNLVAPKLACLELYKIIYWVP